MTAQWTSQETVPYNGYWMIIFGCLKDVCRDEKQRDTKESSKHLAPNKQDGCFFFRHVALSISLLLVLVPLTMEKLLIVILGTVHGLCFGC